MLFEKTKKHILTLKIVLVIIINLLKLRELHTKITSNKFINKLSILKDISKLTYNILTLNIFSVLFGTIPLCMKLKKFLKKKV
jgi:hypothetical protein